MSRTYRNKNGHTWKLFRNPRGRKNAIKNNARRRAIPPDSWDDIQINSENYIPWKVAEKLLLKKKTKEFVIQSLKTRFKISHQLAKKIVDVSCKYITRRNII